MAPGYGPCTTNGSLADMGAADFRQLQLSRVASENTPQGRDRLQHLAACKNTPHSLDSLLSGSISLSGHCWVSIWQLDVSHAELMAHSHWC